MKRTHRDRSILQHKENIDNEDNIFKKRKRTYIKRMDGSKIAYRMPKSYNKLLFPIYSPRYSTKATNKKIQKKEREREKEKENKFNTVLKNDSAFMFTVNFPQEPNTSQHLPQENITPINDNYTTAIDNNKGHKYESSKDALICQAGSCFCSNLCSCQKTLAIHEASHLLILEKTKPINKKAHDVDNYKDVLLGKHGNSHPKQTVTMEQSIGPILGLYNEPNWVPIEVTDNGNTNQVWMQCVNQTQTLCPTNEYTNKDIDIKCFKKEDKVHWSQLFKIDNDSDKKHDVCRSKDSQTSLLATNAAKHQPINDIKQNKNKNENKNKNKQNTEKNHNTPKSEFKKKKLILGDKNREKRLLLTKKNNVKAILSALIDSKLSKIVKSTSSAIISSGLSNPSGASISTLSTSSSDSSTSSSTSYNSSASSNSSNSSTSSSFLHNVPNSSRSVDAFSSIPASASTIDSDSNFASVVAASTALDASVSNDNTQQTIKADNTSIQPCVSQPVGLSVSSLNFDFNNTTSTNNFILDIGNAMLVPKLCPLDLSKNNIQMPTLHKSLPLEILSHAAPPSTALNAALNTVMHSLKTSLNTTGGTHHYPSQHHNQRDFWHRDNDQQKYIKKKKETTPPESKIKQDIWNLSSTSTSPLLSYVRHSKNMHQLSNPIISAKNISEEISNIKLKEYSPFDSSDCSPNHWFDSPQPLN